MPFWPPKKATYVVGSSSFGEQMTLEEIRAAFTRGLDNPAVRAIGQICLAMREDAIAGSASSLADEKSMAGAFNSGAGSALADLTQIISSLSQGNTVDSIKEWFE